MLHAIVIEMRSRCDASDKFLYLAPRTRIVDDRGSDVSEKHYNSGSMIQLKCLVDRVPFPAGKLAWKKGSTVLQFNTSVGGIRYGNQDI